MIKKVIILVSLLLFILQFSYSNKIIVYNIFSLDFNDITVDKFSEEIFTLKTDDNNYMVCLRYAFKYKNGIYNIIIYLRPIKTASLKYITRNTNIEKIYNASAGFGTGDVFKILLNDRKNVKIFNSSQNIDIKKFISAWGSSYTRDIIAYNFEIENNTVFDNCILEFYNIWPQTDKKLPKDLNTKYIEDEIQKNNKKLSLYKIIDEAMKNIKFYNLDKSVIIKYKPKVTNLRFRESPSLKGKYIRTLKIDERLKLLTKGKEETINQVKGRWVKVKTEQGEIGWCFDAYLEKIR